MASRPVVDDRALGDPADAEDDRLRRIEHRRKGVDAVSAEVGDRRRAAEHVLGTQGPSTGALGEIAHVPRDLRDRPRIDIAHHRRREPPRQRDGKSEVDLVQQKDLFPLDHRVEGGPLSESVGEELEEEGVVRDLRAELCRQKLARGDQRLGANLAGQGERDRLIQRPTQPLADRLSRSEERDALAHAPGGFRLRGRRRSGSLPGGYRRPHIGLDDPAARTGADQRREVDPGLDRDLAREGSRTQAFALVRVPCRGGVGCRRYGRRFARLRSRIPAQPPPPPKSSRSAPPPGGFPLRPPPGGADRRPAPPTRRSPSRSPGRRSAHRPRPATPPGVASARDSPRRCTSRRTA